MFSFDVIPATTVPIYTPLWPFSGLSINCLHRCDWVSRTEIQQDAPLAFRPYTIDVYDGIRRQNKRLEAGGGWDQSRTLWTNRFGVPCRPLEEQQVLFSGYQRHHGFYYQAVVCPDGLIGSICWSYKGKANDHAICGPRDWRKTFEKCAVAAGSCISFGTRHWDEILGPY